MPDKIAAVMEQTGKLNLSIYVAIKYEMTWSLHLFAKHPLAAERQMIDIGLRRKVWARFCSATHWLLQHVA